MFGNLKNKIGDVADLKKYASPQVLSSLSGSRQRSSQHTPGSRTPLSRHSRQPSITSLSGLQATSVSPPLSSPTLEEQENGNKDNVMFYFILFRFIPQYFS